MSVNLFDFQQDFVSDIARAFKKHRTVIAQIDTGSGKSVCIAEIARRAVIKGNVICISVHRIEIFEQLFKHLRNFGITPGLIMSGQHPMPGSQVYLSMCETMYRRMSNGLAHKLNINFFILDEAHVGNYYKLIQQLDCKILGFTATPKSTGNPELKEYFETIVSGITTKELIKIGRLVPAKTFSIDYDFSKVKMKGKDFDDKYLFREFKKPKLRDGAVNAFMKNCPTFKALCFNVNVEHSNAVTLQFRNHGIKAAHVDGTTDKDTRRRIFDMYRDNELQIICNVGIATAGVDLPDTQCVIQNFATTSIVKHRQTLGRGGRASEDKTEFIAIDMGKNYMRFGTFDEEIDWKYIYAHPEAAYKKEEKRSKRECEDCGAVIRFHLQRCPYCSCYISKEQIEKKLLYGASVEEIKAYRLKNLDPHLRKPVSAMSYTELLAYSHAMGHSPKWVNIVWAKRRK